MRRSHTYGFTLVEILIVVGIIGIIAAIGGVAYLASLDRARQKRTMADIRTIATAWESRATDTHSYLVSGFTFPAGVLTYDDVRFGLTPTYIKMMPRYDGWGLPYEFAAGPDPKEYGIRSSGRDRVFEGTTYVPGQTDSPDCDIVYGTGTFVRYPAMMQKN